MQLPITVLGAKGVTVFLMCMIIGIVEDFTEIYSLIIRFYA